MGTIVYVTAHAITHRIQLLTEQRYFDTPLRPDNSKVSKNWKSY